MKLINDYSIYHVLLWKQEGRMHNYQLLHFNLDFLRLDNDFDYVLFLKFDYPYNFDALDVLALRHSLEKIHQAKEDSFLLLTNRRKAPQYMERVDEYIYSFCCPYIRLLQLFDSVDLKSTHQQTFLFELLDSICLGKSGFKHIFVKQLPLREQEPLGTISNDVIIPHRGNHNYLKALLGYLKNCDQSSVYVGLDQPVNDYLTQLKIQNSKVKFYSFHPNPLGPYVIRNRLIKESQNDLLFFSGF